MDKPSGITGPQDAIHLYQANQETVDQVLETHRITRVVAFGSRTRGNATPGSDLDLVVTVPEGTSLFDLVHMQDDLKEAFRINVDLLTPGGLRPRLKRHVERDGVVLYEA